MNTRNYKNKTTLLVLAAALITALGCVFQQTHAQGKLVPTLSDELDLHAPPLSVAFHSNSGANMDVYVMNAEAAAHVGDLFSVGRP